MPHDHRADGTGLDVGQHLLVVRAAANAGAGVVINVFDGVGPASALAQVEAGFALAVNRQLVLVAIERLTGVKGCFMPSTYLYLRKIFVPSGSCSSVQPAGPAQKVLNR